jgi:uroporphyrinogen III methyltransferase/synthase
MNGTSKEDKGAIPPRVFLVGAGPGAPGLLTLRGLECLRQADLVIYDKLVSLRMLEHAPPHAERICVTGLADCHVERHRPVQQTMIEAARQGKTVVRLKGGDPLLFGRGGEEAQALKEAGIPFEIVPGVTAALAAGACAGIPLTHRLHASAVAFLTGHEQPDKPESALDWAALARFPGTLVVYMGMSRLARIVRALLDHGKAATTPAAVVQWASTGEQRTVEAPLQDLVEAVQKAGMTAPAIVIIGPVVALRQGLAWFERRPLFGKRILVTRPRHQAGDLVHGLELLGAVVYVLPAVEIRELEDWSAVDQAIANLSSYHWLVFTSANGVQALIGRLRKVGKDLRALGQVRLAAIGPKTAAALRHYYLEPDLIPGQFQSENLARELKDRIRPGERVLLARADRGRDLLRQELSQVTQVDQVAVYSQADAIDAQSPVLASLRRGEIDYVTLTSSNIARAFITSLDEVSRTRLQTGEVKLATISAITSEEVRKLGMPVAAEAAEATSEGVIAALVQLAGAGSA